MVRKSEKTFYVIPATKTVGYPPVNEIGHGKLRPKIDGYPASCPATLLCN